MALTIPTITPGSTLVGAATTLIVNSLPVTGVAADHVTDNLTLALGRMGFETDTGFFKIGDGQTAWISLDYATATTGGALTGIVAPTSTPTSEGALYVDTVLDVPYIAIGKASSADWRAVPTTSADVLALILELTAADGTAIASQLELATLADVDPIEPATAGDINTGTEAEEYITPDAFAGSNHGIKSFGDCVFASTTNVATGDGLIMIVPDDSFAGMNVIGVRARVYDKGVTGSTNIQIRRRRLGANVDVLSTPVTIGDEWTVADGVVNASNDDIAAGDAFLVDVDAVHTTPPKGLSVVIWAQLP
jgi:hypothetical protein